MSNNPLTPQELLTFIQSSAQQGYTSPQFPPKYVLATDPVNFGPPALRLFDAAYITTGIIDPNRLGTGSTGAGNLYLADDGTWKAVSGGVTTLDGLSDVTISAPANAQVLTYNSTTSQWENQTPAAGGGGGDMSKSTYDVDNDGVVDSAETIQIIVRNSTGTTLTKGTVVYLSGATGNRPNAVLSQAHTEATSSKTIGIVVANITNNSDGYVAVNGTLHNLDTSAFTAGDAVWLSAATAGAMTSTIPAEPNHTVFIGYIARSHPTQGRIVILIQNGYELNELHGVQISSEANNDLLVYETSTTLWKNKSIATIFGGTPLVSVPTLAQVTTAGNTTTNAITVGGATISASNTPALTLLDTLGNYAWLIRNNGTNLHFVTDGGTNAFTIAANGNVRINTGTDAGYKLDVNGTARLNGLTSINTTSVANTALAIAANGPGAGNFIIQGYDSSANNRFYITASGNFRITGLTDTGIAGSDEKFRLNFSFSPTSGTREHMGLWLLQTINQTGGANGITRGLYVNPTITAAADFRAIETTAGNIIFNGGNVGIGTATPTSKLFIYTDNTSSTIGDNNAFIIHNNNPNWATSGFGNLTELFFSDAGQAAGTTNGLNLNHRYAGISAFITGWNGLSSAGGLNFITKETTASTLNIKLQIKPNGNVLIGTTTDAGYKLDVNGTARFSNDIRISTSSGATIFLGVDVNNTVRITDTYAKFQIQRTAIGGLISINGGSQAGTSYNLGDTGHAFTLSNNNTTADTFTITRPFFGNVVATTKTIINITTTNASTLSNATLLRGIYFNPTVTDWASIRAIETTAGDVIFNGGNVGIGTSSPLQPLHIATNNNNTSLALRVSNDFVNGRAGVSFHLPNNNNEYYSLGVDNDRYFKISNGVNLVTNIRLSITPSGNVLINTTTDAGYKLDVNGNTAVRGNLLVTDTSGILRTAISGFDNNEIAFTGSRWYSGGVMTFLGTGLDIRNSGPTDGYGSIYSPWGLTLGATSYSDSNRWGTRIDGSITSGSGIPQEVSILRVDYTINTNSAAHNYYGIRISPTLTNLGGGTYTALQSEVGRVVHKGLTNATQTNQVYYDSTTGELTYGSLPVVPTPTLAQVTTAGNTTTNAITVGGLTVDTDTLVVDATNNRVGIGTATPSYPLHISSAAAANIYGTVQSTSASGTAAWVAFNDQSDNVVYRVFGSGASGTQMGIALARTASLIANLGGAGSFLLGTYSATNFIMGTGNAEKMRIVDSTGNVLIATTTDLGNKLEVNGSINSTGYKINNTAGYTGILVIVTNPPGQQNVDIQGGIIVNVF
jgi:hypothetical protein